uniref:Autophagy-related protein 14 n=1 Tax=Blastobotrys adeninivorans TaxID=409370 RepID=A0A060T4R2_BLAAD
MNCGVCGDCPSYAKKFYCPSCASILVLGDRISLAKSLTEIANLSRSLSDRLSADTKYEPYNDQSSPDAKKIANSALLRTRIHVLRQNLDSLRRHSASVKADTRHIQDQCKSITSSNSAARKRLDALNSLLRSRFSQQKDLIVAACDETRTSVAATQEAILQLRLKYCRDLTSLFGIRKRKRKSKRNAESNIVKDDNGTKTTVDVGNGLDIGDVKAQYDVIIGFSVIPDLGNLPHYGQATINVALERVAYFCMLMAYCLDIRLPFEIMLPQRSHSYVRLGHLPSNTKHSIFINSSISKLAHEQPTAFSDHARGFAMLACCLGVLARHRGITIESVEQVARINVTIANICKSDIVVSTTKDMSDTNPTHECEDPLDLDVVHEYIVSQTYSELSSGSNEWSIIDKDVDVNS